MRKKIHKGAFKQWDWEEKLSDVVSFEFGSRFEMAQFIEQTPNPDPRYCSSERENEEWSGSPSLEASIKMLRYGDPDAGKKLAKTREKLHAKSGSTDVSMCFHSNVPERGPSLDIGRFVQDDPEMWMNHRTRVIEGRGHRLVKIFINVSVSCAVKADDILRRMVNVTTAVNELKQAGYSIGLFAGELVDFKSPAGNIKRMETSIKIAEWGHPVQDNILAFVGGNPSFLRRVIFAVNERSGYMNNLTSSYGTPVAGTAKPIHDKFDICFNLGNDVTPDVKETIENLKH